MEYRLLRATAAPIVRMWKPSRLNASSTQRNFSTTFQPWCCSECTRSLRSTEALPIRSTIHRRSLSNNPRQLDEKRKPDVVKVDVKNEEIVSGEQSPAAFPTSLPSHTHRRRWRVSKRMARMMDKMLSKAFVWGQHINVYTGTDYSGIESLRKEIDSQEDRMQDCYMAIDIARDSHRNAHAKQAASQKEVVSLLERKASWSPQDLERYMSLVRAEHTDEQAVQAAKDGLHMAERDLENARAELERLERKQYHEEQIWSDTIRRNSTWVTFGLMGVNIVLLLAQITIFEPYRRRRIVRDVNQALDEKALLGSVERQVDAVVEPQGVTLEAVEEAVMPEQLLDAFVPARVNASGLSSTNGDAVAVQTDELLASSSSLLPLREPVTRWEQYKQSLQDLFSERVVQVKQVDLTTKALQGAATGVATMGLLLMLWRPK